MKPQIFVKNIVFNDDTVLTLKSNSIVVFTGANNSGKSQVLKDIELSLHPDISDFKVIKKVGYDYYGDIDYEDFLKDRFSFSMGNYLIRETGTTLKMSSLKHFWDEHKLYNGLDELFIKRLSTEMRLTVSNALKRNEQPERHPIYKIYNSEALAQKLSDYFHQAFNEDLVVNRNAMQTIPLHVGKSPDKSKYTIDKQDDYYKQVEALPKLQEQGDGMRSFDSILLDTFTSDYTITLIDEPEAFLHLYYIRVPCPRNCSVST